MALRRWMNVLNVHHSLARSSASGPARETGSRVGSPRDSDRATRTVGVVNVGRFNLRCENVGGAVTDRDHDDLDALFHDCLRPDMHARRHAAMRRSPAGPRRVCGFHLADRRNPCDYAALCVIDASGGAERAPVAAVAAVGNGHADSASFRSVAADGPSTRDGLPGPWPGSVPLT